MKYEIINKNSPYLKFTLDNGEAILAEPGTMFYLTSKIEFEISNSTEVDSLQSGISSFDLVEKTKFKSNASNEEIAISPKSIGSSILDLELKNTVIYCDGLSYLASGSDFEFKIQGSMKSVFLGNGLFLQKISGSGNVFLEVYGSIIDREIKDGEYLIVDYGHLVAFESTLDFKLLKPKKGTVNSTSIGEWIVIKFSGPGKIWLQSRNRSENADMIKSFFD